jgi:SAM-dependent methyltransferase
MALKNDPYLALADVYDLMAGDPAIRKLYREWRELLLQTIAERKVAVRTLVDLACGTGNSIIPWTRRRWALIGVDRSPAMLREARRKSDRVRWYRQDIRKLRLKERAEVVTCHFDALNHLLHPRELRQVFARVAAILNEGGLFQFDISTEHFFRWLDGREKLSSMGKTYMMASNKYDADSRIVVFRHLWFIPKGPRYEKRHVEVKERPYSTAEVRALAREAGLRVLKAMIQCRLDGKPVRIVYVLEKGN